MVADWTNRTFRNKPDTSAAQKLAHSVLMTYYTQPRLDERAYPNDGCGDVVGELISWVLIQLLLKKCVFEQAPFDVEN